MDRAQCDLLLMAWEVDWVFCFTQCAHGFVKIWWCQWLVCWMDRAQCDLLLVAQELDWVFLCSTPCAHCFVKIWWCHWMWWMSRAHGDLVFTMFLSDWFSGCFPARIVLLRFGDVIGCDEWAVPMVIWFSLCSFLIDFLVVFHSARIVLLRFGDVIGCDEWAVPMVICFLCCEIWRCREIRFSCVPTVMPWVSRPCRELSLPPSTSSIRFHVPLVCKFTGG